MPNDHTDSDDFDAGFNNVAAVPTPTPADEPTALEPVVTPAAEGAESTPAVAAEPEYVQITKQEWNDVLSRATAIDEIKAESKKQHDTAFGKIGGLQQTLDRLQSQTQAGKPVEITEEDVADLAAEYPDLGALHLKVLQKVAAKMRGTGAAFDSNQMNDLVSQRVTAALEADRQQRAIEALTEAHEDWQTVQGTPEFKAWKEANAATLKDSKGMPIDDSWDTKFIAKQLTVFKDSRKPAVATTAPAPKSKRFQEAITPRGTGGLTPGPNPDDEFNAGFNS